MGRKKHARAAHLGPERRRPEVLDAALALAESDGVRGITMEAVAAALGVTKPVVYACFPTREALVTALLEREEARLFEGVMSALPASPDFTEPEKLFADGFTALLEVVARHPGSWELVFASEPDPAVSERYGRSRERVAERASQLITLGFARKGVKDLPRKLPFLVELFMSAGDAAVRTMVRQGGAWTPPTLGAFVGRVVLAAFRAA